MFASAHGHKAYRDHCNAGKQPVGVVPVLKHPVKPVVVVTKVAEKLSGEALSQMNLFVDGLINPRNKYASRSLAFIKFMGIPLLYDILCMAEETRERGEEILGNLKLFELAQGRLDNPNEWGGYVVASGNPQSPQETALERVSVVNVDDAKAGGMLGKKLVHVADYVVRNHQASHFLADIRYFLDLQTNPHKIPAELKNWKANIFLGTVIMKMSKPYVLAASWRGKDFEIELVCLDTKLVANSVQFVMIQK